MPFWGERLAARERVPGAGCRVSGARYRFSGFKFVSLIPEISSRHVAEARFRLTAAFYGSIKT
jgi:hypothetical protein